jgi:chromosome segregation ATPase
MNMMVMGAPVETRQAVDYALALIKLISDKGAPALLERIGSECQRLEELQRHNAAEMAQLATAKEVMAEAQKIKRLAEAANAEAYAFREGVKKERDEALAEVQRSRDKLSGSVAAHEEAQRTLQARQEALERREASANAKEVELSRREAKLENERAALDAKMKQLQSLIGG